MKKTLLINAQAVHACAAGGLTHVQGMLYGLSQISHDYEIVVICHRGAVNLLPKGTYSRILEPPFNTRSIFGRLIYSWRLHRRIEREFGQDDVVYWLALTLGAIAPLRRIPTIVTLHDVIAWQYPDCVSWPRRLFWKMGVRRSIHCADAIHCISDFTKQQLYLLFKDEIVGKTVRRIYLGCKAIAPEEERAHPILGEKERFLLFVSAERKNKNLCFLASCFHRLKRDFGYPGRLYLAGTIGRRSDVHRTIAALGLEPHVRFLGFVDDRELPSLYRACDAFVFPSYYEGFGLPVVEASYYGAKICASDAASLAEIGPLCGAHCGNPFDEREFTEAIDRAINQARPEPLERGRFEWRNAARQLVEMCDELLARRPAIGGDH